VTTDLNEASTGAEPEAGEPAEAPTPARAGRALLTVVLVAVNVPIVVATVRALANGWHPVGDNGILLVRARDVGTAHHPLLGSWTSASLSVGENVNNPGPAYFDLLAPWVRLLGPWVGLAVGVMLVNMGSSTLAVVAARRVAGVESMLAVGVVVVGLQFAMGSELLFDVWQPNALLLPFLAFLVVAAALACGDRAMLPWAVGVGSVLVQTHLSYAVLVAVLGAAALALGVRARRRGTADGSWRTPALWAVGLAVVLWAQPLIEQFTGKGEGNLGRIVGASGGGDADPVGWGRGLRLMIEIMVRGPWFTRAGFDEAVPPTAPDADLYAVVTTATALLVVAALAVALVAIGVVAARRGRREVATMAAIGALSLATSYVALATAPVNVIEIAVHQMRWLWPVAAFVSAVALTALFTALRAWAPARTAMLVAGAVVVVVVAAVNVPTHRSRASGPVDAAGSRQAAVDLVSQLGALEGRGPILFVSDLAFAEPFSGLVFAEMQDRGIPFVFDDEVFVRQFGEGRRDDGEAQLRMWEVTGPAAALDIEGAERVAFAEGGPWEQVALFVAPVDADIELPYIAPGSEVPAPRADGAAPG
jgi:hypothetical protein